IRRPPRSTPLYSSAASDVYKRPLKNAVRLTFPKGASTKDPKRLFNARLDSNSVRAIDSREADHVDEVALIALIQEAVRLNGLGQRKR
ncbi:MAG TPA: hypothetical protein DIT48_07460, partial [Actinobacteria bacterium]|nr:hypothetical protein [Actinomycetota bacterium]